MTILSAFVGLVTVAKAIIEIVNDSKERKKMISLVESNQELLEATDYELQEFLTLTNIQHDQFEELVTIFCGKNGRDIAQEANFISESILSKFFGVAETEILSILGNKVPISQDFLSDFGQFCLKINQNRSFCRKISFSSQIEFHDSKLSLELGSNTLVLKTKVKMPILVPDSDATKLTLYKVINVGFFDKNGQLNKFHLPTHILRSKEEDTIYEMKENCKFSICPVNGLSINSNSVCAESLYFGRADSCGVQKLDSADHCEFVRIPNTGTLITASNGRFTEQNTALISKTETITNGTNFFDSDGTLQCIRINGRTSFHPIKTHAPYSGQFSLRKPDILSLTLNESDLDIFVENQMNIRTRLDFLEANHNRTFTKIGHQEISNNSLITVILAALWALTSIIFLVLYSRDRKRISELKKSILK